MTKVTLPTPESNPGVAEWAEVYANDKALRDKINGELDSENIKKEGIEAASLKKESLKREQLAGEAKPVTWYKALAIATEESRSEATFGTLTTKDEITEVVVPTNGKLVITFSALIKSSVSEAGRVAIFIGAKQLQGREGAAAEGPTVGTSFHRFVTSGEGGIGTVSSSEAAFGTTGMILPATEVGRLAAGTYVVSVQYKASSGSITAKERLLQVEVHGY